MNKRIRKKKAKQQLIRAISGLVEAAEEMQREQERRTRQAGISYIKYIEAVRERQYGISVDTFPVDVGQPCKGIVPILRQGQHLR